MSVTVAKKRSTEAATGRMVAFRVDEEVLAALVLLEARVVGAASSRRRRSFAIRRAILEAAERARKDTET